MSVERLPDLKARLRAAARKDRATVFASHGAEAAEQLAAHGLSFVSGPPGGIVSGFSAIGDEISPSRLLARLDRNGRSLCLPVMQGAGLPLLFRAWRPGDATKPAVWGIDEPLPSAPAAEPDVLLVPLLAFDTEGYRLGYGGGFYDRTLAQLRSRKPIVAIGLAFDEQRIESVPHAAYDQRLDWVLTPSGPVCTR